MNEQMRMNLDGVRKSCGKLATAAVEVIQFFNDIEKELKEQEERKEHSEPLIEDEKIRREISEWIALYSEHEKIKYFRYNDFVVFRLCRERGTPEPEISLPVKYDCDSLREGKEYTKPDLCGEEEE